MAYQPRGNPHNNPPPAKGNGLMEAAMWGTGILGTLAAGVGLMCYRRVPPNRALVVYGRTLLGLQNMKRVSTGGGSFVIPILQESSWLSFTPMPLEVSLKGALSLEKIRIDVPSVFTVAVGKDETVLDNATVRLLGLNVEEVRLQAEEIILGQLRQVVATLTIEQINQDRQRFMDEISDHCSTELSKIGLELLNVNITNIDDNDGVIKAMGRNAAAKAVEKANVEVAIAEKQGAIGVNKELTEKESAVATLNKDREVAVREALSLEAIRVASLRAEQQAGENESAVVIAESESSRRVREANARQTYLIKDNEVLEAEAMAAARAQDAIAVRVEAEKRVELEAPAKAMKAQLVVEAEAAAEQKRIDAQAEADAVLLVATARAKGEYEMLNRKAEGLGDIVKAVGGGQVAFQLLMLEHMDKLAETSAKAISNIKFDKVVVWDGGGDGKNGSSPSATAGFIRSLASSLPPATDMLKEVAGVEMPKHWASLEQDKGKEEEAGK